MNISRKQQVKAATPIAFLLTLLLTGAANIGAEEISVPSEMKLNDNRIALQSDVGLIYTVPHHSASALRSELSTRRDDLQKRREMLKKRVKKSRFNKADAVIVGVMPGGLLYAALKKHRAMQAEKSLRKVNRELASLKQSQQDPVLLANGIQIASNTTD